MNAAHRLALGTAQWGAAYGIVNPSAQPDAATVGRMLDRAKLAGIGWLDTAPAYGVAEALLGRLGVANAGFRVVTKSDPAAGSAASVGAGIDASLARLGVDRVDGYLLHRPGLLLQPDGAAAWRRLLDARERGRIGGIGISVYSPAELTRILESFRPDIVQLPANIYDQRFARAGLLDELKQLGAQIHARSALLQGVLALAPAELPQPLSGLAPLQAELHRELRELGLTPYEAAIGHCLADPRIDLVVVGTQSEAQIDDLVAAASRAATPRDFGRFAVDDERLILPTNWNIPAPAPVPART